MSMDEEANNNAPPMVEPPVTEAISGGSGGSALARAQGFLKAGQYEECLAVAGNEGHTLDRGWATLRYGAHVRLRQYRQALLELEIRVSLNPLDVEAYNLMGMIHLQHQRSLSLARASFGAALALSPGSPVARSGLSACDLSDTSPLDQERAAESESMKSKE